MKYNKTFQYNGYTYQVNQETNKNTMIDPSVAKALGSYPLLTLLSTKRKISQSYFNKTGSFKYHLHYFFEIEVDKYEKMYKSFNTAKVEIKKGDKVFFFSDLKTPSQNLTSILKSKEASRTRDISKADVIVIEPLPEGRTFYDFRDSNDVYDTTRTFLHLLESEKTNLKEAFHIDSNLNTDVYFSDIQNTWWSKEKELIAHSIKDSEMNYYQPYKKKYGDGESVLIAAKYMEALYYTIKGKATVITENTLDKLYGERNELNYDNAITIINLLKSQNKDDVTMGATVLAESNYMHEEGRPWAHFIYYMSVSALDELNGNYKNIRSFKKSFNDTYIPPANMVRIFFNMYPNMDPSLKKLIIEENVKGALRAMVKMGYGRNFAEQFDITIKYKHEL